VTQALVYRGPGALTLEDRPQPQPAAGEVVIRVRACGICGTDLKIARGEHRAFPAGTVRVPGHEIVGDIAAVGKAVRDLQEGQRVFVAPNVGCEVCAACRADRPNLCERPQAFGVTFDGGFAEYLLIPEAAVEQGLLMPLPPASDPAVFSTVEPLAAVIRGARATAMREGDVVVVCGAGPIGCLHVMVARARLAAQVIVSEPSEFRRNQALAFGADVAVAPDRLEETVAAVSGGRGADVIITAVPVAAVQEAVIPLAAVGGRINFFGGLPAEASMVRIDSNLVHYRELVLTGTTANTTDDCREALELISTGRLDTEKLVTATYALSDTIDAFAAASAGEAMKVVITP
jgi:2-desacetyl-2-hydroxyethyl bacteriochlorophyllide A dehydrogenase